MSLSVGEHVGLRVHDVAGEIGGADQGLGKSGGGGQGQGGSWSVSLTWSLTWSCCGGGGGSCRGGGGSCGGSGEYFSGWTPGGQINTTK